MTDPITALSDVEFKFKEIAFFMKHFNARNTLDLAMMIAKDINLYLKQDGDHTLIKDYLAELENFAPETDSEDYVWELVYARRTIASYFKKKSDYQAAYENMMLAVKQFDLICKLWPTTHNFCCRVLENLEAAECLEKTETDINKLKQIKMTYDNCYAQFKDIKEEQKVIYYRAGYFLYVGLYRLSKQANDPQSVSYERLSTLIDYAIKLYKTEGMSITLKRAMVSYVELAEFDNFSYETEKERIHCVLDMANAKMESGASYLKLYYDRLMKVVRKYENPISAAGFKLEDFF